MDDIDKIFENNPELQEIAHKVVYGVMPGIIESLLLSNELDKTRVDDIEYVWSVVIENLDLIEFVHRSSRIDQEIIESAKDAANLGRICVTVILIATALEHSLNLFYRDVLQKRFELSSDDATEAIRSNLSTKLGWLLQIVTKSGLSAELCKRIRKIADLRNAFVHYKATPVSIDETDQLETLINQVHSIGIDIILDTPSVLERELSTLHETLIPENALAVRIAEKMKEYSEEKLSDG